MSGVAVSVERLREGLEKIGHDVFIFTAKYPGATRNGRRVFRFPSIRWSRKNFFPIAIPFSPKINHIIEALELDIIHSHHPFWLGQAAVSYSERQNLPLVYTYHTNYGKMPAEFFGIPIEPLEHYLATSTEEYVALAQTLIVPSQAAASHLGNINHTPMQIIPSGIDWPGLKQTTPLKAIARQRHRIGPEEKIILCVSRLSFEKNLDFLIAGLKDLLINDISTRLIIVGDGIAKTFLKNIIRAAGLTHKISLPGAASPAELISWYHAADVFAYPSLFETQGLTVLEAMGAQLPIVALNSETNAQYIKNGRTGFLINPKKPKDFREAVRECLSNHAKARAMGKAARQAAKPFDLIAIARRHESVYKGLIRKNAKSPKLS